MPVLAEGNSARRNVIIKSGKTGPGEAVDKIGEKLVSSKLEETNFTAKAGFLSEFG